MSQRVKYSRCSFPLLSSIPCVLAGRFFPEPGIGEADSLSGTKRIRLLMFEGGNRIDLETQTTPEASDPGWGFQFTVRIPSRADRCRLIFEYMGEDGVWKEMDGDDISLLDFPSGRIRVQVSRVLRQFHLLEERLFRGTPAETWKRFFEDSEISGPRVVWAGGLSKADRHKLWSHARSSGPVFGSFYQYEGKEPHFDTFPFLGCAEGLMIPKLTVVTPSFNQASFLGATMDSVTGTEESRIDYILMDGGSTDHSVDLIQERSARFRHWQSNPDKGQASAIADGFRFADCEPEDIMSYLNSDDLYCPGAIDYVLRWFALHPEVDVVYGHRIIIDEAGCEVGRWVLPPHDPEVLSLVDFVPQETLFWRKRVYDEVGGIDPSFQFAMDWDFLLKLNRAGARFERLPWFLGCFRVHGAQKTQLHINDTGSREVALLRRREHGDEPLKEAIGNAVIKTTVESFWYAEQISRGIRI